MTRFNILLCNDMKDPEATETLVGTIEVEMYLDSEMDPMTRKILADFPLDVERSLSPYFGGPLTSLRMERVE